MATTESINTEYGIYYRIDSDSSAEVLTVSQMESNVSVIYNIISDLYPSWTLNAISALCGNAQSEGALNPNQWQYGLNKSLDGGYGLWQWTPATKFLNWCSENGYPNDDIKHQIMRLEFERTTGIQYYPTSNYNFSFTDFLEGNHTVQDLALAWLYNYERPKNPESTEQIRIQNSERWFKYLSGETPQPPEPPKPQNHKSNLKFYMYPVWRTRI